MKDINIPNGIAAVGYSEAEVVEDIAGIFARSMQNWED
jgi:hypothetical protein